MVRQRGLGCGVDWSLSGKSAREQWLLLSKEGMRGKAESSGWETGAVGIPTACQSFQNTGKVPSQRVHCLCSCVGPNADDVLG